MRADTLAGVSVAFVLIPQAIAYASLAGMPPERGLYVAALAPMAAALFASSPYLGTGPTAITSLLAFGALSAVASPGGTEYIELAALLALTVGLVRVVLGLVRAGIIAYLLSQPVVVGFTSAAGVVILASQIPAVLGLPSESGNPFVAAYEALTRPADWGPHSIAVALAVVVIVVGGNRLNPLFPGILVAVGLAIVYSRVFDYPGPVVGNVEGGAPPFSLSFPWSSLPQLAIPAAIIAVVGFSEPASIARHYATLERRRWDPNRELISQGVANLAAGLGGGFPAGGSFARSALVRSAGARTRLSGGITGLVVLVLLAFMPVLSPLPMAVLGASIMVAVTDLIDVPRLLAYRRYARLQFFIAAATFVLTLALAPHVERAVIAGVLLAVGAHLWRELKLSIPAWTTRDELHLRPQGVLYFASTPGLEEAFSRVLTGHPEARTLVLHLDGLGRVDLSGALVLRGLLDDARDAGLQARLADVPPQATKIVARVLPEYVGPPDQS